MPKIHVNLEKLVFRNVAELYQVGQPLLRGVDEHSCVLVHFLNVGHFFDQVKIILENRRYCQGDLSREVFETCLLFCLQSSIIFI